MGDGATLDGWQDYLELKKMLVILGDVVRLNLVRALARVEEINVTDLAQLLLISQPLVSWHLSRLRRVGLVRTRRQGRQVYCSLDAERYAWCLRMLAEVVEAPAPSARSASSLVPAASAEPDGAAGSALSPGPTSAQVHPAPHPASHSESQPESPPDIATPAGRSQAQRSR